MHRTHTRRRRGFSLIEVMVSLFMVAAAASMFFAIVPSASKTGKMVGNYQQATSLVQHKIDQLRGVGYGRLTYSELLAAGIIDASPNASPFKFNTVDSLSTIYRNATTTLAVSDFDGSVKQVTVTLTWTGSQYAPGNGTISVSALIARS